jgi:protein TonB
MHMAVSTEIWTERDPWSKPLGWSVALHSLFLAGILLYSGIVGNWRGGEWGAEGGGGGAMSATLVSTIPLPANPNGTNVVATESKGVSQSPPQVAEKAPDAIPIPERNAKRTPPQKPPRSSAQQKPKPVEEASNIIPFGQGGPLSGPLSVFSAGGAKGGFGFTGGGGDFGSKYSWYVDVVRRKISENWLKYEVDPRVSEARRVYITFDIVRSGQPVNVQVEQSSGVPSLDISAVRAIQRIDTFGPLPGDYAGNRVGVEFWFDYRR